IPTRPSCATEQPCPCPSLSPYTTLCRSCAYAARAYPELAVPEVVPERSSRRALCLTRLRGPHLLDSMESRRCGPRRRVRHSTRREDRSGTTSGTASSGYARAAYAQDRQSVV